MVGYDMSIVGPLLSLPMFTEKYQGNPGPLTVSLYCYNIYYLFRKRDPCAKVGSGQKS